MGWSGIELYYTPGMVPLNTVICCGRGINNDNLIAIVHQDLPTAELC